MYSPLLLLLLLLLVERDILFVLITATTSDVLQVKTERSLQVFSFPAGTR